MRGNSVSPYSSAALLERLPEETEGTGNPRPGDSPRLVREAQAGDPEAFASLVQPYMRKAYYIALKITRNREDAEDVSQQAFLKALANIGQFRGVSQFSTWLTRIVMNEALMVMRRRRSDDSHLTYDLDFEENQAAVEKIRAESRLRPEVLYEKDEE